MRTFTRRGAMALGASVAGAAALAACGEGSGGSGIELRMSTQQTEGAPIVGGFEAWGEAVSSRTDGEVTIDIFPSAQLGSDEDVIEQALNGVNVAVLTDGAAMGNYVKELVITNMPYITDDYDDVVALVGTDSFQELDAQLREQGIRILAYNWYDGPRNFYTNKDIATPADLNGQRIRTAGAPVWQEGIASLGATPIAMPWGEAYNALQSGALDGVEVQAGSAYPASLWEVTSTMTRTSHIQLANFILVGETWASTVPEDILQIIAEECVTAATDNAQDVIASVEEFESLMVEEGLVINEIDDQPFREASEVAYEKLEFVEFRDAVWSEMGKA